MILESPQVENPPNTTVATHQNVTGKEPPSGGGGPVGDGSRPFSRVWLVGGATVAVLVVLLVAVAMSGQDASNTVANTSQTPGVASPQDEPGAVDGTPDSTEPETVTDTAVPSFELGNLQWSRIPRDEEVFGGDNDQGMYSVAAAGPGLVAVGYDVSFGDRDAAVWIARP